MSKERIADSLRALAKNDKKRSKAARLRDVIDDVEATLAAGVSRADVLEALKKEGLEMSMATFETTLRRIRNKRSTSSVAAPGTSNTSRGNRQANTDLARDDASPTAGYQAAEDIESRSIRQHATNTPDLDGLAKYAKGKKK